MELVPVTEASCIEIDQLGRLLIASFGKLYVLPPGAEYQGLDGLTPVADLTKLADDPSYGRVNVGAW